MVVQFSVEVNRKRRASPRPGPGCCHRQNRQDCGCFILALTKWDGNFSRAMVWPAPESAGWIGMVLTRPEIDAFLAAPDQTACIGREGVYMQQMSIESLESPWRPNQRGAGPGKRTVRPVARRNSADQTNS
jgi:hypothetical protein